MVDITIRRTAWHQVAELLGLTQNKKFPNNRYLFLNPPKKHPRIHFQRYRSHGVRVHIDKSPHTMSLDHEPLLVELKAFMEAYNTFHKTLHQNDNANQKLHD